MNWPEAFVALGAMGTFCFVIWWLAQGEKPGESFGGGYTPTTPLDSADPPCHSYGKPPKTPPPAKVGQRGKKPKVPLGNGRMIPM